MAARRAQSGSVAKAQPVIASAVVPSGSRQDKAVTQEGGQFQQAVSDIPVPLVPTQAAIPGPPVIMVQRDSPVNLGSGEQLGQQENSFRKRSSGQSTYCKSLN